MGVEGEGREAEEHGRRGREADLKVGVRSPSYSSPLGPDGCDRFQRRSVEMRPPFDHARRLAQSTDLAPCGHVHAIPIVLANALFDIFNHTTTLHLISDPQPGSAVEEIPRARDPHPLERGQRGSGRRGVKRSGRFRAVGVQAGEGSGSGREEEEGEAWWERRAASDLLSASSATGGVEGGVPGYPGRGRTIWLQLNGRDQATDPSERDRVVLDRLLCFDRLLPGGECRGRPSELRSSQRCERSLQHGRCWTVGR